MLLISCKQFQVVFPKKERFQDLGGDYYKPMNGECILVKKSDSSYALTFGNIMFLRISNKTH